MIICSKEMIPDLEEHFCVADHGNGIWCSADTGESEHIDQDTIEAIWRCYK
jgi:hypothetical protein